MHNYIISYHRTAEGYCWINGITGGYVEQHENGKCFRNMEAAINHRIKDIEKIHKEYMENLHKGYREG